MKRLGRLKKGRTILAVLMTAIVMIGLSVGVASAVITGSKHDLSTTGPSKLATDTSLGQLCVFCHTPHTSNKSFTGAPLWNKQIGTIDTQTYSMYGGATGTMKGTMPAGTPSGISKACLSCHDGVNAMDSFANAPGSGLTNAASGTIDMDGDAVIGADLSDDHPISIAYTETTKASLRLKSTDLIGTWTGATTIADVLRGPAGSEKVECSSCHDPHETGNGLFLRGPIDGSKLCLSCHGK